jgi:hypothetical protein
MTNTLKFVARADLLVRVPFAVQFVGQAANYVNRSKRMTDDGSWAYPADDAPYEVPANSKEAERLVLLTRRDEALWPFDEQTAEACGTKFIAVECIEGEWVPVAKAPAKLKKVANEG